jgi:hypothetical protein
MVALFWITFIVFVVVSALLVGSVLLQEPKQSGLGGLDGRRFGWVATCNHHFSCCLGTSSDCAQRYP